METRKFQRQKGRRAGPSFVSIPHFVLRSKQWAALSGSAVKLLLEMAAQYHGRNNGDLSATYTQLQPRGWSSKETLQRALSELETACWIERTRYGGRHVGCSLYAITWWPRDASKNHPEPAETKASHAWKNENGPPKIGERCPDNRGAKSVEPRKSGSKVVRIRSAA